MIELNIEGIEDLRNKFARLVPETQAKVLKGLAHVAFDTAQAQVDTHTQTGALFDSIRLRPSDDGGWIIDHDLQRAPHAVFVHFGTKPHLIKTKNKKALRWARGSGGGTSFVFAKWVHHPGYNGHAYLVEAADEAVKQFDSIVRSVQIDA